jgi:hypothetical protein
MALANSLSLEWRILQARLTGRYLSGTPVTRPVFLIGTGRSGKSTLGATLAHLSEIAFIDESRPLWIASFPRADIWSARAAARGGSLYLGSADADPRGTLCLGKLLQRAKGSKALLLQALAANSFRVAFLRTAFPQARFIHVIRDGMRVAADIAARADKNGWYGRGGYKWRALREYAQGTPEGAAALALCENNFDRGLLEWRLGIEAVRAAGVSSDALLEIRYEELAARPAQQLGTVLAFLGLDAAQKHAFALATHIRPLDAGEAEAPDEKLLRIGGPFLRNRHV